MSAHRTPEQQTFLNAVAMGLAIIAAAGKALI